MHCRLRIVSGRCHCLDHIGHHIEGDSLRHHLGGKPRDDLCGGGFVIEAIGSGVEKRTLAVAVSDASLAVAFRHVRMTPAAARAVVQFAQNQVGKGYDHTGIIGQAGYQLDRWFLCSVASVRNCEDRAARANLWMSSSGRFFCSELVAEAYRQAGVPLVNGRSDSVSPERIVAVTTTGDLAYVGHVVS